MHVAQPLSSQELVEQLTIACEDARRELLVSDERMDALFEALQRERTIQRSLRDGMERSQMRLGQALRGVRC